jgi:hypothetical protein
MPIDDPISALQSLNASDERQGALVSRFAKPFLAAVKLFALPAAEIMPASFELVVDWVSRREDKNREELLAVIAEEVKYRGVKSSTCWPPAKSTAGSWRMKCPASC